MRTPKPTPTARPADHAAAAWPHIDVVFLDEDEHDETDAFFQTPVVPCQGETLSLDGDFRRCGTFVVERLAYTFCCQRRVSGWVRDLGVHVCLYVRPA